MKNAIYILVVGLTCLTFSSCQETPKSFESETFEDGFYPTSKPFTRWWWFATEIKKEDVTHQLDWAKANNFGGVEIAWVYPLYRYQKMYARNYNRHYPKDTTAQKWLSKEWTQIVAFTKQYADSIGLVCDFTFGSAWPVASSNIGPEHSTQIYGDTSFRQKLTFSWEWPKEQLVINHLDPEAFALFSGPIEDAIKPAMKGKKNALFTDSWEIKLNGTNKIWTDGFDSTFKKKYGYSLIPFMEKGLDSFPHRRYQYMMHLDQYVTNGFYKPYVEKCKELGAWSRVQCLASPTDVMTTYGMVDIPESEAMLNNPSYSRIVSSSACLSSKPLVSSESFTCMYGFPSTYQREEQTADLKMLADALFAEGINHHVYHGMPYNPKGSDTVEFFATTFIGPGGNLTQELPALNNYLGRVSGIMRHGKTYSDVAVYIPYEDGVMKGAYPPEKQRVWVWGEYEMRFIKTPEELEGYHPMWINRHFLEKAKMVDGRLVCGDASFSSLYIDVDYMDPRAFRKIKQFAKEGLPICLKRKGPSMTSMVSSSGTIHALCFMKDLPNVETTWNSKLNHTPLISGEYIPPYWCRVQKDTSATLFLANPKSKDLEYPLYSGQSFTDSSESYTLTINYNGVSQEINVVFKPYQAVMLHISKDGEVSEVDITFVPKDPVIKPREPQKMNF